MFVRNFCVNIMVVTNNVGLLYILKNIRSCAFHFAWVRSKSLWATGTILISGLRSAVNSECERCFGNVNYCTSFVTSCLFSKLLNFHRNSFSCSKLYRYKWHVTSGTNFKLRETPLFLSLRAQQPRGRRPLGRCAQRFLSGKLAVCPPGLSSSHASPPADRFQKGFESLRLVTASPLRLLTWRLTNNEKWEWQMAITSYLQMSHKGKAWMWSRTCLHHTPTEEKTGPRKTETAKLNYLQQHKLGIEGAMPKRMWKPENVDFVLMCF